MDFDFTSEQRQFTESVAKFAANELNDDLISRDHNAVFPVEAWHRCARFGLPGLPVPTRYGGSGADAVTIMSALESLGYGCRDNGLIFSLNAHMWAGEMPIVRFGTEQQRRRYLPALCDGSLIIGHASSEPDAGSDPAAMATRAVLRDGHYILNGTKTFVTNAPVAGVFLVLASTNANRGFAGLSAFLIDRDAPGLTVGPQNAKLGLRTSPMSDVTLANCRVSAEAVLGPPGAGMSIFNAAMREERSFILASVVGTMRRNLERSIRHAQDRRQFGHPIGKFQAVSHRIVDMKLRLETTRLLLYKLGWLINQGEPTELYAALVKLHISDSAVQSGLDAIQVHGGSGFMTDLELERDLRDAIGSRIYSGTTEIQKNLAARLLGLGK